MKTVLIIDDDADYRMVMAEVLEVEGWQVFQAEDGDEGIKLAQKHRPAAIVCDLRMPKCNGFQVCRTLHADKSLRETKIIVSSGRDFQLDRQMAFDSGAHEYLTKPFKPSDLVDLLARLCGLPPKPEPTVEAEAVQAAETPAAEVLGWIKFWGVRGSIATPGPTTVKYGGNTSCVEVRADGQIIILDAGTGLRLLGRQLLEEFGDQPLDLTLLLTHTHWDHIQGLPFFLPVYKPQNQLRILGYEGARHGLDNVLTSQMESPFFPIGLREVPANVRIEELQEGSFDVGTVRVEACIANHPGICVGYRVFTSGGSVAFFPDNEPYRVPPGADAAIEEHAQGEHQKLVDFLRGVDVLIMDTQYDSEEYLEHVGWGHGCLDDVVALALQAEVRQLCLFHHDPSHDDAKIAHMVAHARQLVIQQQGTLQIEAAREGARGDLPLKAVAALKA